MRSVFLAVAAAAAVLVLPASSLGVGDGASPPPWRRAATAAEARRGAAYAADYFPTLDAAYEGVALTLLDSGAAAAATVTASVGKANPERELHVTLVATPPAGKTFDNPDVGADRRTAEGGLLLDFVLFFASEQDLKGGLSPQGLAVDVFPSFVDPPLEWVCDEAGCA